MPITDSSAVSVLGDFIRVMRSLTYREVTALAFTLGRHRDTVSKWRYLQQKPDAFTMLDVIKWHKQGKPTRTMHHRERQLDPGRNIK